MDGQVALGSVREATAALAEQVRGQQLRAMSRLVLETERLEAEVADAFAGLSDELARCAQERCG